MFKVPHPGAMKIALPQTSLLLSLFIIIHVEHHSTAMAKPKTKYGRTMFHGTGAQAAATVHADVHDHRIMFVLQCPQNGFSHKTKDTDGRTREEWVPAFIQRLYGSALDLDDFFELYRRLPPDQRSMYSINRSQDLADECSALHLDIEWLTLGDGPCPNADARMDALAAAVRVGFQSLDIQVDVPPYIENLSRPSEKRDGWYLNSYHVYYGEVAFESNSVGMKRFVCGVVDLTDPLLSRGESLLLI
jgi:hypothetical protein